MREVGVNLFTLLVTDRAEGASIQYGAVALCSTSTCEICGIFFMQLKTLRNHRDIAHE